MEVLGFTTDGRAWRRLRALRLKQEGWYQRAIADAFDVSEVSLSRWFAPAGSVRAPRVGFRGRIGVLSPAWNGQDLRSPRANAGHTHQADPRSFVRHGRDDAGREGLHVGAAEAAQRAAQYRIPHASAARGGGAAAWHPGRLAHPPSA